VCKPLTCVIPISKRVKRNVNRRRVAFPNVLKRTADFSSRYQLETTSAAFGSRHWVIISWGRRSRRETLNNECLPNWITSVEVAFEKPRFTANACSTLEGEYFNIFAQRLVQIGARTNARLCRFLRRFLYSNLITFESAFRILFRASILF